MDRIRGLLNIIFVFLGLMLAGATVAAVLIQFRIEGSLSLTMVCIASWVLYLFTAFRILSPDE